MSGFASRVRRFHERDSARERVARAHALALGQDEQRIDVELLETGLQIERHLRKGDDGSGERVDIAGGFSASAREDRVRAQFADHVMRLVVRDGREAERDILEHFGVDPAEAAHHGRTERRVVLDPDDDLDRVAYFLLQQHAFDGRTGRMTPRIREDFVAGVGERGRLANADAHRARFCLVRDIR